MFLLWIYVWRCPHKVITSAATACPSGSSAVGLVKRSTVPVCFLCRWNLWVTLLPLTGNPPGAIQFDHSRPSREVCVQQAQLGTLWIYMELFFSGIFGPHEQQHLEMSRRHVLAAVCDCLLVGLLDKTRIPTDDVLWNLFKIEHCLPAGATGLHVYTGVISIVQ